jgi:prepilin-type N-terminal cleavage/methylation domain-containing protein
MRDSKYNNGVTLIELLIAIAITSIIGIGLVSLQYILSQNQIAITKNTKSVDDANYIVTMFTKELRRSSTSETGSYLLSSAGDQNILFYSDSDLDGQAEKIQYRLDGTRLIKTIIQPTSYPISYPSDQAINTIVSNNIRNGSSAVFFYYNEDYPNDTQNNPLPQNKRLSDTRTVKISLRVNTNANNPEKDYIIDSFVTIRMLKDNL